MKPFLLFAGKSHELGGGMVQYVGDFNSPESAQAAFWSANHDWFQIVRHADMSIVNEGDRDPYVGMVRVTISDNAGGVLAVSEHY